MAILNRCYLDNQEDHGTQKKLISSGKRYSIKNSQILNKVQIQILKNGFSISFELIQVIGMMDCQFEAVIHGKDGLGCWAIEGKVIIHKLQCAKYFFAHEKIEKLPSK